MGITVTLYLGAEDGLETILLAGMPKYREWLYTEAMKWPQDHDPLVLATADSILDEGGKIFKVTDLEAAKKVDDLVSSFLGDYCDYGAGQNLLEYAHDSFMNIRNYYECSKLFKAGSNLSVFWNYILKGRPVGRDAMVLPFNSIDDGFRVSFLTATEVSILLKNIETKSQSVNRYYGALNATKEALENAEFEGTGLVICVS